MPAPIAILGAGTSGLLLARLLEIKNIDYILYDERGPNFDPHHHGTLDCQPDTIQRAFAAAGLDEEWRKVARFEVQVTGAFDHRGEVITRNDLDLPSMDWPDMRRMLIDSVPAEKIRWHTKIDKVDRNSGDRVAITFGDGSVEDQFKLVVGADGVWSKVRHLVTSAQPTYFGTSYLRTSISLDSPFWDTVQGQHAHTNYIAVGLRRQLVCQRNVCGTYTVFIGAMLPEDWNDPTMADPAAFRTKIMETELAGWKSSVLNFVRHSDGPFWLWKHYVLPAECLSWDPQPGVTLIGDALHPTLPWPGEAMSTVLMDALQLGEQIVKFGVDALNQAVAEYETVAFPRRKKYIEKVSELGRIFYSKDAAHSFELLLGAGAEE